MAAALSPRSMRAPRLRFSLGGMMFIFVFGVSVGLAYWRFAWVTFIDALLASFTTWFLIGITQRLWRDLCRRRQSDRLQPEARWGIVLQIGLSIGIVVVLAIAATINIYCGTGSAAGFAWNGRPAASSAAYVLFFLAVMGAYWSPPLAENSSPTWLRVVRPVYELALLGVAAFWAAKAFMDYIVIFSLVQIAIRGVENYQPILWAGRPLSSPSLHSSSTEDFYRRLLIAFTLLAIAGAAGAVALHYWRRGWKLRVVLLSIAAPCALAAGWLIAWWWNTGFAQLSPYFATAIQEYAHDLMPIYGVLVLVVGAAAAMSLTVTRQSEEPADTESDALPRPAMLHEHVGVVGLCIFAILAAMVSELWPSFVENYLPGISATLSLRMLVWGVLSCLGEYVKWRAEQMIGIAAVVVLSRFLWRRFRRLPDVSTGWLVDPGRFLATWLLSTAAIFLVTPIVIWAFFGFALSSVRV